MANGFRPDIQGLRAIAVGSVVIFHFFPEALPGGFTGVDIFFVISGFLITQSLLKGGDRPSLQVIADFYQGRVRRLFPALFVLIACCLVAGAFLMFAPAYRDLALSALSSVLFVSNFYFQRTSGYFDAASETKPLLHIWSLSLEEQFYLVFPLFLLVITRFFSKRLFAILLSTALILFLLSEAVIWLRPDWSYYFTGARAFELAIGCTLAVVPNSVRVSRQVAQGLALAGLASMLLGFILLSRTAHFPGAGALFPCLGAAALLFAGAHHETLTGRALSAAPMRFLGDISYSFYLWHWPPLAFLNYYYGSDLNVGILWAAVLISLFVSWLSYRYVEQPFLRKGAPKLPYWRLGAGLTGVVCALCLAIVALHGVPQRFPARINELIDARNDHNPARLRCHHLFQRPFAYDDACIFGRDPQRAKPLVAIWGDSHGAELAYALGEKALGADFAVLELTASGCPPALGLVLDANRTCGAHNERMLRALLDDRRVKIVVLTQFILNDTYGDPAELRAGLTATLSRLRAGGKQVIVMLPIPTYDFDPPDRLARRTQRGAGLDDTGKSRAAFDAEAAEATAFLKHIAARFGARTFDPMPVFCDSRMCQLHDPAIGPLYFDEKHAGLKATRVVTQRLLPLIESGLRAERVP